MEPDNVCPCPNLDCPNHGNCQKCTSRHLRLGTLNYCAFYSILPELNEAVNASPGSPSAKIIQNRIDRQTNAYMKRLENNGLTEEYLCNLRMQKSKLSDH